MRRVGRIAALLVTSGVFAVACLDIGDKSESSANTTPKGGTVGIDGAGGFPNGGSGASDGCGCDSAPAGWSYATFAIAAGQLECPAGYLDPLFLGDELNDTGCASCQCGPPVGDCSLKGTGFSTTDCTGSSIFTKTILNTCLSSGTAKSLLLESLPGNGVCPVISKMNPVSYTNTATICHASASENCPCSPVAPPPFRPKRCVVADDDGDIACPSGFSDRSVFGNGIADQRSCTGCACDPPTGSTCTAGGICQSDCSGCVGGAISAGCKNTAQAAGYFLNTNGTGGSCAPKGTPQSNGKLDPAALRIVCCEP